MSASNKFLIFAVALLVAVIGYLAVDHLGGAPAPAKVRPRPSPPAPRRYPYGRGLARIRMGDAAGKGDQAAALTINPEVADDFSIYGLK